ncbi:Dabb family protein [Roseovarius sp. SCSIO 43702]|uniref:Dabb family protein n=1 Tax=Roseovarius sp. SCSIO 43702 TaxID=2823043 RepID=UPI001C739E40|nr:Dabb family protein [Roseovarius sp. SCSIO 43702]QYX55740.1 Dabb family protein [Roseovarius sp. SCSIO 43702]
MIRHIVFFSARDRADLDAIHEGLMTLSRIPHARHFELGRNLQADTISETHVDIVVYAEFEDEEALAAYKAHPLYAEAIRLVRPLRETRIAADFHAT